jgi:hypothetical protein
VASERPKRQFWLHQAAEYVIGLALVATGLQAPEPALPALAGGLVMINAAIVDGPLAAFRIVGRRTHQVLDWVVIAAISAGIVLPFTDVASRLMMVAFVVVLVVVATQTNYGPTPSARAKASLGSGDRSEEIGRWAGRWAGKGANAVKRRQG